MKTLVALSSCQAYEDKGLNEPLRQTWLPMLKVHDWDYKFFHGNGSSEKEDVIVVPCDDGYWDLTSKTKLKIRWALDHNYDYVFMCFPDLYASVTRLVHSRFERADYFGCVHQHPGGNPYCQGGPGYFLSRKALKVLDGCTSNYPNDDCWVGDMLHNRYEIHREHCDGFRYCGPGPLSSNNVITNHLSTQPGGYKAEAMYAEHKNWLDSHEVINSNQ